MRGVAVLGASEVVYFPCEHGRARIDERSAQKNVMVGSLPRVGLAGRPGGWSGRQDESGIRVFQKAEAVTVVGWRVW